MCPPSPVLIAIVALLLFGKPLPAVGQMAHDEPDRVDGHATVVTGDTLRVAGALVQLYGIDAPELGQTCWSGGGQAYDCGELARTVLERFLGIEPITCWTYAAAQDDRDVGRCFRGSADLGLAMVSHGWARAQRGLSHRYAGAEARAQMHRAGMWSGASEAPWVWRDRYGE